MRTLQTGLVILFFFLTIIPASAQPICGFDAIHRQKMRDDSTYRKTVLENEARIQRYISQRKNDPVSNLRGSGVNAVLYTIPVVIHIVHTGGAIGTIYNPTDVQVTGAINYLNQVYNGTYPGTEGVGDLQIQFALATRDPFCNPTSGIDRIDGSALTNYTANGVNSTGSGTGISALTLKNFDRWDPDSYYNIWVVNKIDTKDGTSGQFIAGFAALAGGFKQNDGTVMLATQMVTGQKTLPHEIGHALSLYHPFEGSADAATCPSNSNCSTDGDKICDTDPIAENLSAGVYDFSCRTGANACAGGSPFTINTEKNFMNYTNCYTLFTAGQKARMLAAMSLPGRVNFANAQAVGGAGPVYPFNAATAASCSPATSSTGTMVLAAGIMNVSIAGKSFSSAATAYDGGYVDKSSECIYLVPMQRGSTYSFSTTVYSLNREQVRIWIDYNNDGQFSNTTEQVYYNPDIPKPGSGYATVSGSFTVPATTVLNTVLRMRVLEDYSTVYSSGLYTITDACYNPTYGQAEDYPVYFSLAALPVKLEYFTGVNKNNDALLSWKTSYELNAKEFQVEKSTDGNSFYQAGTVPAANTILGATYSFTDKDITATDNYYRLRQVDKDQKSELSKVVLIKGNSKNKPKWQLTNNPFTDRLDMVFNGTRVTGTTLNLFTITGQKIYSQYVPVSDGQLISLDVSKLTLPQGMYLLQAQLGEELLTKKLIKR